MNMKKNLNGLRKWLQHHQKNAAVEQALLQNNLSLKCSCITSTANSI